MTISCCLLKKGEGVFSQECPRFQFRDVTCGRQSGHPTRQVTAEVDAPRRNCEVHKTTYVDSISTQSPVLYKYDPSRAVATRKTWLHSGAGSRPPRHEAPSQRGLAAFLRATGASLSFRDRVIIF